MNKIYDNGTILLGTKKNIEKYAKKQVKHFKKVEDDYVVETFETILKELEEFSNETIVAINYDCGMGYSIDYWNEDSVIKECK